MASALVAIRGAGENFVFVVRLTLRRARADVENGGVGHLVRGETTLGASLARVGLHAEQVAELFQKRLRLAEAVDGTLVRLFDDDRNVGHLVKVILEVAILVRERAFLGRVVLGRQQKRVPVARVRNETYFKLRARDAFVSSVFHPSARHHHARSSISARRFLSPFHSFHPASRVPRVSSRARAHACPHPPKRYLSRARYRSYRAHRSGWRCHRKRWRIHRTRRRTAWPPRAWRRPVSYTHRVSSVGRHTSRSRVITRIHSFPEAPGRARARSTMKISNARRRRATPIERARATVHNAHKISPHPVSPSRASTTLAHAPRARSIVPRAGRSAIPATCIRVRATHPTLQNDTYRDEAHRFATRGVFVFTRRAHRDARALSASRARGDDGRRDDGRRENAGHHHREKTSRREVKRARGRRAPRGVWRGGLPRVMTRRSRASIASTRGWFFVFIQSFSRFIVFGRARVRRTVPLSRARSNREITRDSTTLSLGRCLGRDGIVMGHDSSFRVSARHRRVTTGRTVERTVDRSVGRARGSRLHE